jgi:Xaa-Pro aminopeptidase
MFRERREAVLESMGRGALIIPSAPTALRNNDVEHDYRQESDLFYLTGFEEPESVLLLTHHHAKHRVVLFLRTRDPSREVWDGPRVGVDRAVATLGVDAAFDIAELDQRLPEYLENVERVYYRLGRNRRFDDRLFAAVDRVRTKQRTVRVPTEFVDPAVVLHEKRLVKTPAEIDSMRRAASITAKAHHAAMRIAKPGRYEYEVEAELLHVFRKHGSPRPAYGPIVGSGPNATVLHYRKNDRKMEDGDLLLIDAGCEVDYYASDVTRTFPISGRFTPPQRAVYQVVLDAQERAIDAVQPGVTVDDIHRITVEAITEGLVKIGLLSGALDELVKEEKYKPFYMHRTSHWLGMDVHDVGSYLLDGSPRPLGAGMVITIEPGIYIAADAEVDEKWRGIGVRIEDDILVTDGGSECLTYEIPKEVDEIEAFLAKRDR